MAAAAAAGGGATFIAFGVVIGVAASFGILGSQALNPKPFWVTSRMVGSRVGRDHLGVSLLKGSKAKADIIVCIYIYIYYTMYYMLLIF